MFEKNEIRMKPTSKKQDIKNGEFKYFKIRDFCGNGCCTGAAKE